MIRINRRELIELARLTVVANTAPSLFRALLETAVVARLRRENPHELVNFYDRLTARAGRSEIVIGLSYAILLSLLLNEHPLPALPDSTRLKWGNQFKELAENFQSPTQVIDIPRKLAPPRMTTSNEPSTGSLILSNEPWR